MQIRRTTTGRPDEDVDLVELWQILLRRKGLIAATVALSLLTAGAYLLFRTPVYEAAVAIQVGQVAGKGPFESAEVLHSRLLAQHGRQIGGGRTRVRPYLSRVTIPRGPAGGAIELIAEAYAPDDAVGFLSNVIDGLRRVHTEIYEQSAKSLDERLTRMEAQRLRLETQYDEASGLIARLKQHDPVQASLVALERARLTASIIDLDNEKPDLVLKLSRPETRPTEQLSEIQAPLKPVGPGILVIIAIALVAGTTTGALLAFANEFFGRGPRLSGNAPRDA
jgi:hypothetical protein